LAEPENRFAAFVERARGRGQLVVQPRMGFSSPAMMRAGLLATRGARACALGTITLDSFTRVGDHDAARRALERGEELNGFPLVVHGVAVTGSLLHGIDPRQFPVQVRHGTPSPESVMEVLVQTTVEATEGGPVSYTLPYSRVPLEAAVASWERSAALLAEPRLGVGRHVETFGGCMLGQLCPPELLVALSVLEALFFVRSGIRSVSLSYAQQTNYEQDLEALDALRRLAAKHLGPIDWHVVLYTWMGLFPRSPAGARALIEESARLARQGRAERLLVKTAAEAHRVPEIAENVAAMEWADAAAATRGQGAPIPHTGLHEVAGQLVERVLEESERVGEAIRRAFGKGLLDVPHCLHPDNRNRARSCVGADGRLHWTDPGRMPIDRSYCSRGNGEMTAAELLANLAYNRDRFDRGAAEPAAG
jgi:methylaspartate mutase epsilon subunit